MLTPFVLFVALMIATAFIAHWSDNLGKKLGKKRVSLFGLRPRTTATVLTIVSSWGIMFFTLLVLLGVFAPLRNALLQYDAERRQNIALKKDTAHLVAQRDELTERAAEVLVKLKKNTAQTRAVEARLATTRDSLRRSASSLNRANTSLKTAQGNEKLARASQASAARGEARASRLAREALFRQQGAQTKLGEVQSQLKAAGYGLTLSRERLKEVQGRLREVQGRLTGLDVQLQRVRGLLYGASRANLEMSRKELELRANVEALGVQKAELDRQVKVATDASQYFLSRNQIFGLNPPRLLAEQVLAERSLPPRLSPGEALATLREVFLEGQAVMPVYATATQSSEDVQPRQAKLALFTLVWNGAPISEEDTLKLLTQMIASSTEPLSLRLVSARNYFEGETEVEGRFIVVPVVPGYRDKQLIVEEPINPGLEDAQVFKFLLDLIEKGRLAATNKKINPPLSPQKPDFYSGETKVRLFETLRKLEKISRPTTVRLVADGDQTSVEPLRVRFEVE